VLSTKQSDTLGCSDNSHDKQVAVLADRSNASVIASIAGS